VTSRELCVGRVKKRALPSSVVRRKRGDQGTHNGNGLHMLWVADWEKDLLKSPGIGEKKNWWPNHKRGEANGGNIRGTMKERGVVEDAIQGENPSNRGLLKWKKGEKEEKKNEGAMGGGPKR